MSDNQRTIVGLLACFLAIFLYMNFVLPRTRPERLPPAPAAPKRPAGATTRPAAITQRPEPPAPATHPAKATTTLPAKATTLPAKAVPKTSALPEQKVKDDIVCETELFRVVLTNRGAAIKSVTLRDFYMFPQEDPKPGEGDLKLITEIEKGKLSLTMAELSGAGKLDTAVWQHVPSCPVPTGFSKAEQFKTRIADRGLEITKTFLFREPERTKDGKDTVRGRDIQIKIAVRNLADEPVDFAYHLRSAAGIVPEPDVPPTFPLEGRASRDVVAVVCEKEHDGAFKLETFESGKADDGAHRHEKSPRVEQLLYAGAKNRYFVAVLEPLADDKEVGAVLVEKIGEHNVAASLEFSQQAIPAGGLASRTFMFVVMPRIPERLREYEKHHFETLLDLGWLGPIKKALTWLLQTFYKAIPNYGWAVVLLTACVRLLLHPLTLKSQKAAHKMQEIQPLVKAVKEKYKHDKQVQQQEVMKIMREQGANPLGGCLPVLLQIPIFIGLWRSLYENANLRHAPFMLWINDLSKADNLFSFESALPIIGRSFNLLPLLCAAVMVVQQKLTPKSQDPQAQQTQKMMMFMPILFAFMLYGMPSGLMIYFFCSSLFGVAEQHLIRRRLVAAAAAASTEPAPVPVEPKRQKSAPQKRKKRRRR
ncbi:MAG: membrane protein insertase YidC [Planctomycetota bacterium]